MNNDEESSIGSAMPPDAGELLREELMKLSFEDRNKSQDEIHGVGCSAINETPEILNEALSELDRELNSNILPVEERRAYLKSQELFANTTYVNSKAFRLRFLRSTLFDVPKAAERINQYLSVMSDVFGEFTLERAPRISDFSKAELQEFRMGRYQFLPYRDRAPPNGRRILAVFPDEKWQKMSTLLRTKIWLYLTYVVGEDVEAQKSGIVVIVWFDNMWKDIDKKPPISPERRGVLTYAVRTCSVHMCTPDTPMYRYRRAILLMRLKRDRTLIKIHVGTKHTIIARVRDCLRLSIVLCFTTKVFLQCLQSFPISPSGKSVELLYILQSFGLPTDFIPISYTGTVKDKYIKKWIQLRQRIEDERLAHNWTATNNQSTMIECPQMADILFRNGTSLLSHPANSALRSLIAAESMLENNKKKKQRDFLEDIITKVKADQKCRFLKYNEQGWWEHVQPENERQEIEPKISRIIRETRKLVEEMKETSHIGVKRQKRYDNDKCFGACIGLF